MRKNLKQKISIATFSLLIIIGMMSVTNIVGIVIDDGMRTHTFIVNGYVYDQLGNPLNCATVRLYKPDGTLVASVFTNSNGFYSINYPTGLYTNFKLIAFKTYYESSTTQVYSSGLTVRHFYIATTFAKKIAYLFYASDASSISNFNYIFRDNEGFDMVEIYKDVADWEKVIDQLDDIEGMYDFIFLYFAGHGGYSSALDDSYLRINANTNQYIYSSALANKINVLESRNIMIVIESCYSGGFYDDMKLRPFTYIITSTDKYHPAYYLYEYDSDNVEPKPDIGYFSYYFFNGIKAGKYDTEAYKYARTFTRTYRPNQFPCASDLCLYTWFLNW